MRFSFPYCSISLGVGRARGLRPVHVCYAAIKNCPSRIDLLFAFIGFEPDVEAQAHHVDVGAGIPGRAADGIPKLLDFGIAKIIERQNGSDQTNATMTMLRVLTPRYASPEQVRGQPITTASDVFSLGVILYELLTGRGPYGNASVTPEEAIVRSVTQKLQGRARRCVQPEIRIVKQLRHLPLNTRRPRACATNSPSNFGVTWTISS